MSESVADDILRAGYQRWLRLEEEKAAIGDDLKELFAELKVQGFTPKPLRESFRRVRNIDDANQQEHDAIVDLYVASLTRGTRAYTHESSEQDSGGQVGVCFLSPAADGAAPAESASEEISATYSSPTSSPETKADGSPPPESSADQFEPPAFLAKERLPLTVARPHCHTCKKAAGLVEAA